LYGLRLRAAAELLGLGRECVAVAAHDRDPRPGAGERLSDGRADTAPAAGDDGVSTREAVSHWPRVFPAIAQRARCCGRADRGRRDIAAATAYRDSRAV